MTIKTKNKLWLLVSTGLILLYFVWIIVWKGNDLVVSTGVSVLSVAALLLPSFWLWRASQSSTIKEEKTYWKLLFLHTFFYLLAELYWIYMNSFLSFKPSFVGGQDIFYACSGFLWFLAFTYRIWKYGNKSMLIKLFFDISIVMIVSTTFTWHYMFSPVIAEGTTSLLSLVVALFYPIGDLLLLMCVATFYFGGEEFFSKKVLYFILVGLCVHILSDSIYFYEIAHDTYSTGSWYDPLFILPKLLIGYTALIERGSSSKKINENKEYKKTSTSIFRILLPYFLVIFLFVFMVMRSIGLDAISIGSGLSIVLVILRQFIVISENQKLVKQYHQKTEQLEISEEKYKSLFEYHPDSVFSLDLKGKIESMNSVGATLLGEDKNTIAGFPIINFVKEQEQAKAKENFSKVKEGLINSLEYSFKSKDGKELCIDMTHIPIRVKNKLVGVFGIGRDVTENKLNEEKIRFYAYHDHLTGLANRRLFEEKLKHTVDYSKVNSTDLSILFLDLDKFKNINDVYGHDVGDKLLCAIAERIKQFIGDQHLAARMGGDEFTILLNNLSTDEVQVQINTLSSILNKPYLINNVELDCTSSIGVAHYPTDGITHTELLNKADNAMYIKKKGETLAF